MESANYEFSAGQNVLVSGLAGKMNFVGYSLVITAAVFFGTGFYPFTRGELPGMYGIVSIVTHLIGGAIYLAIGSLTIKAAKSFRLIVETKGNDIENLMDALAFLLKQYNVQFWIIVVALLLLVLGLPAVLYFSRS